MDIQDRQDNSDTLLDVPSHPVHPVYPCFVWLFYLFCSCSAVAVTNAPLALRYARLYERELTGEQAGLVRGYQALYAAAREADKELAEKILNRIGMCEKKSGRLEEARAAWRALVETYPLSDPVVSSARDSLKALEWEMDRVTIVGRVSVSPPSGEKVEIGKCIVFAGEWGSEPPVLTGGDGVFKMERRAAGKLPDGRSYGLIHAQHSVLPLVGVDVWTGPGATGITVSLAAPVSLAGRVLDHSGNPVAEARIRIIGFKTGTKPGGGHGEASGGAVGTLAQTTYPVPFPVDRLIPPVFSGTNGTFVAEGLPSGLRYEVTPEKHDYRGVLEGDVVGRQGSNSLYATTKTFAEVDRRFIPGMARADREKADYKALSNLFTTITWLRGGLESGASYSWADLKARIVVFHFGSAYGEASLFSQYPVEGGGLSRLMELYAEQGVLCLWILPEGEGRGEAAQLALGLYPEFPVGVRGGGSPKLGIGKPESDGWDWAELGGNLVMGRDGSIQAVCTDQQVFRAVIRAMQK